MTQRSYRRREQLDPENEKDEIHHFEFIFLMSQKTSCVTPSTMPRRKSKSKDSTVAQDLEERS
jgi:hypothetical protein